MNTSLNKPSSRKRTGVSKKNDYEYEPVGDPISQEGAKTGGLSRACDVIYYILAFGMAVATLILVILIYIHVCGIETEVAIIKDCVLVIKDCAEYIKTWIDYIKDKVDYIKDKTDYIKDKADYIHDIEEEQRMTEAPYECDDYNVCTKDFLKQGACMNLPVHCDSSPVVIAKDAKKRHTSKNVLCDAISCHDKCYADPASPTSAPPPMVAKNGILKRQAGLRSGSGPNGECGHGHDLGKCVPSTECKGTCDPGFEFKKDVTAKNGGCHPQCPYLNFEEVFYYPPSCQCSECHQCQYEGIYHFEDQPVYSFDHGPDLCLNKDLQQKKCMAALKNEYLKECIRVDPVCDFDGLVKKDDSSAKQKTKVIGEREYPIVDVYLRCVFSFECAKPVIWFPPAPTLSPTPSPTLII